MYLYAYAYKYIYIYTIARITTYIHCYADNSSILY